MAEHEGCLGKTDEWYTPPWVFEKLGILFDMDGASPGKDIVPWITAGTHISHNSLSIEWFGSVWLNPPYGGRNGIIPWLAKMATHGNGIALVPNRTGADWWQDFAAIADGMLFVRGKIKFIGQDGLEGKSPGYGNVLMAFGSEMKERLYSSKVIGFRS